MSAANNQRRWPGKFPFFYIALLVTTGLLTFFILTFSGSVRSSAYSLEIGDVAGQDVEATRSLTFNSSILTEQAEEEAVRAVPSVYLPADPGITRRQIELMRTSFNYISIVRNDIYAHPDQKLNDLASLSNIRINETLGDSLLELSQDDWNILQQESLVVLEQVMRTTIRENQTSDAKRNIPTLISFSLPQDQADIVEDLVIPFVVGNSLFSKEQTEALQQTARETIEPITRRFIAGEMIVEKGQVITPLIWEALTEYNLIQSPAVTEDYLSSGTLVLITLVLTGLYFSKAKDPLMGDRRGTLLITISFLVLLFLARWITPNRTILPYLFPIPALGLIVASLYSMSTGVVFSLAISVLAAYGQAFSLDLTLFYLLSSICGILVLGRGRRIASFFWAGIASGFAGSAVLLAYRLVDSGTDWLGLTTLIGSSFLNGMLSASVTLLLQFIFAQIIGTTTALQLLEVSRPDHPLLQLILQNAPGTYQHSLMVSNLAEQAAKVINADTLLVRVGALHHDAGKALNPNYFIENQIRGKLNPHNDLDPKVSSETIVRHVTDGIKLAQKYRLPLRVQDFIREHHGTLITRYQYAQAVKAAGNDESLINKEDYRYPGPIPNSRETALLMLADGVEARARAEVPKSEEAIRAMIKDNFDYILHSGQLENTNITLKDLHLITESFVATLKNTYHQRIEYPKLETSSSPDRDIQKTRPVEKEKTIPASKSSK